MQEYDVGDRVRLSGEFTADGELADPSEVKFQIRNRTSKEHEEFIYSDPSKVIKRTDVGLYYVIWTWSEPGVWYYRFVGSGSIGAASEEEAFVRPIRTLNL